MPKPAKHHWTRSSPLPNEAQENAEVILGMFSVNNIPAMILFDSGASHSFISRSFVAQN